MTTPHHPITGLIRPDRPVTQVGSSDAFARKVTTPQRLALLAGARDPLGLLPNSVNLRTLVALAGSGLVGLDQSKPHLRGRAVTRSGLEVFGGALTAPGWERARAEGAGPYRILIVGCGKTKQDRRMRAGSLYVGTFHGSCRLAAESLLRQGGRLYILSAAHGLLDLDTEIDPYELTIGDPGSVSADTVRAQAKARGIDSAEVTVLAGSRYVSLAREVWPDLTAPLAGAKGIGEMRQRLRQIRVAALQQSLGDE